jgi:phage N-6-adenine-methyltransferase
VSRCGNPRCRRALKRATTGRPRRYCSDRCRVAAWRKRQHRPLHFSSKTCEWATPPELFADLAAELGPFDLDPCATPDNAKCARYFTRTDDGLSREWTGRVFVNPPYGREIGRWVRKAWEASRSTADVVVCLVPARVDTAWWHEYVTRGEVRFLRGRVRFGGAANGAPFPSAVVVFRNAAAALGRYETGRLAA